MSIFSRSIIAPIVASLCFFVSAPFAHAEDISAQEVETIFTRYLAVGRNDVDVQITTQGSVGVARIRQIEDGSFTCFISGLGTRGSVDAEVVRLVQKGKVIHEFTHCLISPHVGIVFEKPTDLPMQVALDMTKLTHESIADARSIIEIFRKDGPSEASRYVNHLFLLRGKTDDITHSTTTAVDNALKFILSSPQEMSDADAFANAIRIGRVSAEETFRKLLTDNGHGEVMESALVQKTLSELDVGLEHARIGFTSGRYKTNAITIRMKYEGYSPLDYHVFVDDSGTARKETVIGMEGAHGFDAFKTLVTAPNTDEHRYAVLALTKHKRLSMRDLNITRTHFERFVKNYSTKEPKNRPIVLGIIERVIANSDRAFGMDEVFNEITRELMRTFE